MRCNWSLQVFIKVGWEGSDFYWKSLSDRPEKWGRLGGLGWQSGLSANTNSTESLRPSLQKAQGHQGPKPTRMQFLAFPLSRLQTPFLPGLERMIFKVR